MRSSKAGRLFTLVGLAALANIADTNTVEDHAPRHGRALQTDSNIVWIGARVGTAFTSAEEDAVQLQAADRGTPGDASTTITTSTTASYELYFSAPDITGATGFTLSFVGQLDGAAWTVEVESAVTSTLVNAGTLTGMTTSGWGDVNIDFPTTTPEDFVKESEILVVLSATDTQVGYLDYAGVTSMTGTPTTTPTAQPVAPPVAAPVAAPPVAAPVAAPVEAPQAPPVASPTPVEGVTVTFVEKVAGVNILQLEAAEGASVTESDSSMAFVSQPSAPASYELFFHDAVVAASGSYAITITAQLSAAAVASNWQVEMYSFGSSAYVPVGDLAGVTSEGWTTITLTFSTETPEDFVEPTENEYQILLKTEAATSTETLYMDLISVSATAAPAPTPVADPTPQPVAATSPPTSTPEPVATNTTPGPVVASTPGPTAAPSAPSTTSVEVDLVPCIFASEAVVKDVGPVASAYLFNEFFKGFWTATQNVQDPPAEVLDLLVDDNHGRCSVIFVGIVPSDAQKTQLQDYSRKFHVRIVYFDAADTIFDEEVILRLGMESRFDEPSVGAPLVKRTGGQADSVVPSDLTTDRTVSNVFNRPVVQTVQLPAGVSILAQYADASGTIIPGAFFDGAQNAGIVEYIGDDGLEELHVFLGLAWFDQGSWAWAHFIAEWGTKGVFQGERRFYLGAVVDDLFLQTGPWIYDPPSFESEEQVRLTGAQLETFQNTEASLNAEHGAAVMTEFAFNGYGVLEKVNSAFRDISVGDTDTGLPKGQSPTPPEGKAQVNLENWLSLAFNPADGQQGLQAEYDSGLFDSDDLLARVKAAPSLLQVHSHTLTHLLRDNIGEADCDIEDGGNVRMAIMLGLYDMDTYSWRSMTSPGITGLFNPNCLKSGQENLMTCYPGDNTYSGPPLTNVSLIDLDNAYHSVTTTLETNGYGGMQVIPRFATNIYYNCVSGQCLIDENEKIRRVTCGCEELDPSKSKGACPNPSGVFGCVNGTSSFNDDAASDPAIGPLEALFQTEERTTGRYLLSGRRDKYMFHQGNLIPTSWPTDSSDPMYVNPVPEGEVSLLAHWYARIMADMGKHINTAVFPMQTLKFDNLCHNFYQHEWLDSSGAVLTATKDTTSGSITGMSLYTADPNGAPIPLTVPTTSAAAISAGFGALTPSTTEIYGADTTFTFAAGTLKEGDLNKPDLSELPSIPQATTSL